MLLNLGRKKLIGAIRITSGHPSRVPTKYIWECSPDSHTWIRLANIESNDIGVGEYVDRFDPRDCISLKLTINKTVSGPPQIAEIEVIEDKFAGLDFRLAGKIENNPFDYVSSGNTKSLMDYFLQNGVFGKMCFYTDKFDLGSPRCKMHGFKLGVSRQDSILVDQGGTVLQKIEILVPKQVKINLKNVQVKYLTFDELVSYGQVAKDGQFRNN